MSSTVSQLQALYQYLDKLFTQSAALAANGRLQPALEQLAIFRKEALTALHAGTGDNHVYGLSEMRVPSNGPEKPTSHLMEDDADPHIFIFAPYEGSSLACHATRFIDGQL